MSLTEFLTRDALEVPPAEFVAKRQEAPAPKHELSRLPWSNGCSCEHFRPCALHALGLNTENAGE